MRARKNAQLRAALLLEVQDNAKSKGFLLCELRRGERQAPDRGHIPSKSKDWNAIPGAPLIS